MPATRRWLASPRSQPFSTRFAGWKTVNPGSNKPNAPRAAPTELTPRRDTTSRTIRSYSANPACALHKGFYAVTPLGRDPAGTPTPRPQVERGSAEQTPRASLHPSTPLGHRQPPDRPCTPAHRESHPRERAGCGDPAFRDPSQPRPSPGAVKTSRCLAWGRRDSGLGAGRRGRSRGAGPAPAAYRACLGFRLRRRP